MVHPGKTNGSNVGGICKQVHSRDHDQLRGWTRKIGSCMSLSLSPSIAIRDPMAKLDTHPYQDRDGYKKAAQSVLIQIFSSIFSSIFSFP